MAEQGLKETRNVNDEASKPPAPDNGELEAYRKFVLAAADSGEMIYNRTPVHAGIIIECLFRKSRSRVDILTGTLDPVVYGTPLVIAAASDFIRQSNAKVTILHDGDVQTDHLLVREMKDIGGDRFSIERVPTSIANTYPFHFAVGDKQHFRFEKEKENCEAVAQFGNARGGKSLTLEFEKLKAALTA